MDSKLIQQRRLTAVGAGRSAIAVHVTNLRPLCLFRQPAWSVYEKFVQRHNCASSCDGFIALPSCGDECR